MEWFFWACVWVRLFYLGITSMDDFLELDEAVAQYKDAARNARAAKDDHISKISARKSAETAESEAAIAADGAEKLRIQKRDAVAALMA